MLKTKKILQLICLISYFNSSLIAIKPFTNTQLANNPNSEKRSYGQTTIRNNNGSKLITPILQCSPSNTDTHFLKFLGKKAISILQHSTKYTYKDSYCYEKTDFSYIWNSDNSLTLTIQQNPPSFICKDTYLLSIGTISNIKVMFNLSETELTFDDLSKEDIELIQIKGLVAYEFCDLFMRIPEDITETMSLFSGSVGQVIIPDLTSISGISQYFKNILWPEVIPGKDFIPTASQVNKNVQFIKQANGYIYQRNEIPVQIPDKNLVNSGDIFMITRMDGIDPLIFYVTGSHIGHCVIAVWDKQENELYIVEVQEAAYWPVARGVQRNKYDDWMKYAQNAAYSVVHLRLSQENAKKFDDNLDEVWRFFNEDIVGLPYSFETFVFSWLDDIPEQNEPDFLDIGFWYTLMTMIEEYDPVNGSIIFKKALNKRLGTENLNLHEIQIKAHEKGQTQYELIEIPEQDDWEYDTGLQFVCSTLVARIWKEAGLFEGFNINANEFTPRDIYQVKFFDDKVPDEGLCGQNPDRREYCQVMGDIVIELPGYNSIEAYDNMNERCRCVAPLYERRDGC